MPDAQNRALRVISFDDRETVHNAFFGRGFLKARSRSQPSTPVDHPRAPASLKERREGFRFLERRPDPSGSGPPRPASRPCHATSWRPLPMPWRPLRNGSGLRPPALMGAICTPPSTWRSWAGPTTRLDAGRFCAAAGVRGRGGWCPREGAGGARGCPPQALGLKTSENTEALPRSTDVL